MIRKLSLLIALCLICALPQNVQASEAAWFTILKPDGSPFQNTSLYMYDGDIKFEATGNMYPYGSAAKEQSHFLSEVMTDEQGHFGIRVQNYTQRNFIFIIGSVYYPVGIGKSNDLAHTTSDNHIRVVEWEEGSTRVKANHIYNWRERSVVTIPLLKNPLPEKLAERIILKAIYLPKLAPYTKPLEQEKISALLKPLGDLTYNYHRRDDVNRAIISDHMTLRAYAATYMGKYGTVDSVPLLIDALSDESAHVGANYVDAGMATTRHRAQLALKNLVGEDFGFQWDTPLKERQVAINKWKEWLNERNIILDLVKTYIKEHDMDGYSASSSHMNAEKTKWSAVLTQDPPMPGSPVLVIDRKTHEITFIQGY